jgi:hypothetical protein
MKQREIRLGTFIFWLTIKRPIQTLLSLNQITFSASQFRLSYSVNLIDFVTPIFRRTKDLSFAPFQVDQLPRPNLMEQVNHQLFH